ncbi:TetR family transcriptional regulator [Actinoallomurus iriomotensis]|uniref:TetR family transcriptional regulator n=1 Tax=Actinoallomurus iriomotensis TaxID=478107 RepID=A0A9W6REJ8_9ACTN|nr:TetR family transcriptional regulator [Actinoallomurus iriomotensis]GLY74626.1 TetR family transcriptional regulator [Actinoallomurus iriomotensis]GLY83755.1 TetR family transcriptional regulator [Actinoallomurus iriomotensis]
MTKYRSQRRADAAAQTRAAILSSARELFLASGYSSVTVAQIAAAAGVAVQTVYSSAGGKTAILADLLARAVHDPIVDESLDSMAAATDPQEVIDITAAGVRRTHERHWDVLFGLLHDGLGEPAATQVQKEGVDAFVATLTKVADRLVKLEALRPDVDHTLAVDLLWFYLGQRSWFLLVGERGWDFDRAEEWLAASARRALLRDSDASR